MSKPAPIYTDEMTKKDWTESIASGVKQGVIWAGIYLTILNVSIWLIYLWAVGAL